MKRTLLFPAILAVALAGCSRSDRAQVREETRARTESTQDAAAAQKREYERKMDERLDRIDRAMDEERAKHEGHKLNAKAEREYNQRMSDLRKLREETREKYKDLKNSTADGWERFKDGVDSAADRMDRAWDKFVADMKS